MRRGRVPEWCGFVLLVCLIPALALAQTLPAGVPAVPSAAPAPPPLPSGLPSALPAAPAAPAPAPSAPAPPAGAAPAASASAGGRPPPPEDTEIILEGQVTEPAVEGVPATLPRELQRNAPPDKRASVADKKGELTIEELVNAPVVSASRRKEGALSAPAFVIVLTAKDMRDRGYTDMSQILDDLPGMDVVRAYGDVYVKSYWRGYRPGAGADPYLVMIDGVVFNSLFYGDAQILATFPISDVDHVEIVYGPASAVYGPDAAMGVINVITRDGSVKQSNGELGTTLTSKFTFGGPQRNLSSFADSTKLADATFSYIGKDFRVRITSRFENAVLDRSIGDEFEYTKPAYYADPRLYGAGGLSAYANMAGQFRSPDQKRAVDARLFFGNTELAAQYFSLSTGLGTRYAADRLQTSTPWTSTEMSLYGRHTANLSGNVISTTFLQFRVSDVASPSSFLQSSYTGSPTLGTSANFAAVQAPNSAIVFAQDFAITAARNAFVEGDSLELDTGLKYQHINYSDSYAYITNSTYPIAAATAADATAGSTNLLAPGSPLNDGSNSKSTDTLGAYLLGKYSLPQGHAIHLGARVDTPPLTNEIEPTVRGGYVGTFDKLVVKAFYGQAAYAPGPYDYEVAASLGHPVIKTERSQTLEGNVEYSFWKLALHGDIWMVDYTNPIVQGVNLTTRNMSGFDLGVHFLLSPIKVWAYYSRYITAQQSTDAGTSVGPIGDLAFDKVWGGITFDKGPFMATLLGRWMGPRDTVSTNPIPRVPAYFTLDANVAVSHIGFEPLWAALRVTNILDTVYYQPGMETAGSGNSPGVFTGGQYIGSKDLYNSLLPQPRRALFFTLGLDL